MHPYRTAPPTEVLNTFEVEYERALDVCNERRSALMEVLQQFFNEALELNVIDQDIVFRRSPRGPFFPRWKDALSFDARGTHLWVVRKSDAPPGPGLTASSPHTDYEHAVHITVVFGQGIEHRFIFDGDENESTHEDVISRFKSAIRRAAIKHVGF